MVNCKPLLFCLTRRGLGVLSCWDSRRLTSSDRECPFSRPACFMVMGYIGHQRLGWPPVDYKGALIQMLVRAHSPGQLNKKH